MFFLIVFLSNSLFASETYVYCEKYQKGKVYWHWLKDQDDHYVVIKGEWGVAQLDSITDFKYFTTTKKKYLKLYLACRRKYGMLWFPAPADSRLSDWSLFKYNFKGNEYFPFGYIEFTRMKFLSLLL